MCMVVGGHGWQGVHTWQGACMAGGHAWWGACMAGGVHGRGHVWWGVCVAGGHAWQGGIHGRGAYMVGAYVAGEPAWQGGVCGSGGTCVAVGGACMACMAPGRYYEIRSMSGLYASYWNAFLCINVSERILIRIES